MLKRTVVMAVIALFIFMGTGYFTAGKGGIMMAMSKTMGTYSKELPKIDNHAPAATETATFALG